MNLLLLHIIVKNATKVVVDFHLKVVAPLFVMFAIILATQLSTAIIDKTFQHIPLADQPYIQLFNTIPMSGSQILVLHIA